MGSIKEYWGKFMGVIEGVLGQDHGNYHRSLGVSSWEISKEF
jgi:hypothetical protein